MKPFALISDLHLHNWSAFASVETGGNSRLLILVEEIKRAVKELRDLGGDTLIVAGDVFHVRGSVSPSVLNPTLALFQEIVGSGIAVFVIAGNHDLEGERSTRLGSAVTALESVGCICVSDSPLDIDGNISLFPWREDLKELRNELVARSAPDRIAVIHAPINGVIKGLPDIGLDPQWLAHVGYRGVFSGHYHNHKEVDQGVYSIGAIAHHSWSDVGSKAGYLIVEADDNVGYPKVTWRSSRAPEFVELMPGMTEADMKLASDGNYVKARIESSDLKVLDDVRKTLLSAGARGVIIVPDPVQKSASRESTAIRKGMTLPESVAHFINAGAYDNKPDLIAYCGKVMTGMGA